MISMTRNCSVLVAILVVSMLSAFIGCKPPPPSYVPAAPNASNVVAKVVAVRWLTEKSYWEVDVEILHSYDVPGYLNFYKSRIGQVVTALTSDDVSQLKGQVINARIRHVGDEHRSGISLSLLPPFPQRIVSLGPKITEILVALGASEKIVGIDDFSQWPSTIPRLGEPWPKGDVISPKLGIDTNAIVALHPDRVIADGALQWAAALNIDLEKAGIPVVYLWPVAGVTGALNPILSVGAIVGEMDKAEQLVASYEKRKQAVVEGVRDLPKVRVVLAQGYGGGYPVPRWSPLTEDDPLNELIQLAGGVNVFTSSPEDKNMVQELSKGPFTLEPYIAKNPEVILVLGGLDQWQLDRPGWEKVDAVQKGRVHAIGEMTPLTVLDRLEEIAKLLHPGIGEFDKTIISTPPNTPTDPSPFNHATGVPVDAVLTWVGGDPDEADFVTYAVYFGTNENPPLVSEGLSDNLFYLEVLGHSTDPLSYDTKYYWRVVARDLHGTTSEGPIWDFTTRSD